MDVTIRPGARIAGRIRPPGDKSIAHRWLVLAATARGRSELRGLPAALDVRSTARVLAMLSPPSAAAALEGWASEPSGPPEDHRSTANNRQPRGSRLDLEADGRGSLHAATAALDCGNSGTTMRLLAGVLASCLFETRLRGDESLERRPMRRVAEPLAAMGAVVETTDGHAPLRVRGGPLRGIRHRFAVPSAQVKGAVLLAGVDAEGRTVVEEPVRTRDHTERALAALGAPVSEEGGAVGIERHRHEGFSGAVPGDLSSAGFLVAAAALTGGELTILDVGLNPTRSHLLQVLGRMGVRTRATVDRYELGEPVGVLEVEPCDGLVATTIAADELPLVIDEVPVLALLGAHAAGETRFESAGELRVKESDRLGALETAIRALGGDAAIEGDDLVVAGGGLRGGRASGRGDHRIAMALAVGALAAAGPVEVEGMEAAEVSFPGFVGTLRSLGARVAS